MAKTDYTFAANTTASTFSSTHNTKGFSFYASKMHANAPASDGVGATTVGQGNLVLHTSLDNPLTSSIAGDYCRGWSSRENIGGNGSNDAGVVVALVTSSAGGSGYPVTDTPSNGTLTSISMRAFLRIQSGDFFVSSSLSDPNLLHATTNIGFVFKTEDFAGNQGNDLMQYATTGLSPKHGYCVSLGTAKLKGDTNVAYMSRGGPPLLQISANNHSNPTGGSNHFKEAATNIEYAVDTWYHVRADLIPAVSKDTINVYTAPISGVGSAAVAGLGSETWTLVATKEIASTDDAYIPWGNNTYDKCGFFVGHYTNRQKTSAGNNSGFPVNHDFLDGGQQIPLIDKFQFLTKDVS